MVQTLGQNSVRTVQLLSVIQVALQKAGLAVDAAHELAVTYLYQWTALRAYVAAFDSAFVIGAAVMFVTGVLAVITAGLGAELRGIDAAQGGAGAI